MCAQGRSVPLRLDTRVTSNTQGGLCPPEVLGVMEGMSRAWWAEKGGLGEGSSTNDVSAELPGAASSAVTRRI